MEIIILVIILITITLMMWLLIRYVRTLLDSTKKEFQNLNLQSTKALMSTFYQESTAHFLKLANDKLNHKQHEYSQDIDQKKDMIEKLVRNIQIELGKHQKELQQAEKDRAGVFSSLSQHLKDQQKHIDKLGDSTSKLNNILSDNRLRGNWGERTLEDIMQRVGFIKGKDYSVQTHLSGVGKRPDFIINLANNKKVCIDVKFPLDNLKRFLETDDKWQKKQYLSKFRTDILTKVKDVTKREYISIEDNTVDFAIIFVPSEMVYNTINNYFVDVIDTALTQKIIFTSPFAFYALIRTISEANRNFHYEKNIKKVIQLIELLNKDFNKFQDEFLSIGKKMHSLQEVYNKITTTRYNKLEKDFIQIKTYQEKTPNTNSQTFLKNITT